MKRLTSAHFSFLLPPPMLVRACIARSHILYIHKLSALVVSVSVRKRMKSGKQSTLSVRETEAGLTVAGAGTAVVVAVLHMFCVSLRSRTGLLLLHKLVVYATRKNEKTASLATVTLKQHSSAVLARNESDSCAFLLSL